MTPQERAAAVLDQMVVNLPPRDARDYNEQVIENALRHARRAALLEVAELHQEWRNGKHSGTFSDLLRHKLAQEG